jgi:hypothetical protein
MVFGNIGAYAHRTESFWLLFFKKVTSYALAPLPHDNRDFLPGQTDIG